ncbi:MAG: hypothetical protein M1830_002746 [Pleopsidium flavum]|nr:MAG: hypothetical protein M1830_002746 [Pleopsidium flavum]
MNILDAINARLRQLEELEARMLTARKSVLEKRRFEDEKSVKKRGSEDAKWHLEEQVRENEEDELRARKRQLSKAATNSEEAGQDSAGSTIKAGVALAQSSLGRFSSVLQSNPGSPGTVLFRSSAKTTKKSGGGVSRACDKRHGPPDFKDGEGRPMWIRPSDGRFVYLKCSIGSCTKMNFATAQGFLSHVVKVHQRKGMYVDQKDALEKCGLLREEMMGSNNMAVHTAESNRFASRIEVGPNVSEKDDIQDDEEPRSVKKEVIAEKDNVEDDDEPGSVNKEAMAEKDNVEDDEEPESVNKEAIAERDDVQNDEELGSVKKEVIAENDFVEDDEEAEYVKEEVIVPTTEVHEELDIYGDGIQLSYDLTGESVLGAELYQDALLNLTEKEGGGDPEFSGPKVRIRKRSLSASIWDRLGKRMRVAEKTASGNFRHQSA